MNIDITEVVTRTIPYPKLMRSTRTGSIFLMTEESVGTKIARGANDSSSDQIATHNTCWTASMEDFTGSITLSN